MKKFEWKIDEDDNTQGVKVVSFVDVPAMESNFIAFSKEKVTPKFIKLEKEGYKQVVAGLAMIPDKEIPRIDAESGEEYVGYFSAETIEDIRNKFHKEEQTQNVNTDHEENETVDAFLIESYILNSEKQVEDLKDKGIEEAVEGAWYVAYKIEDEEIFNKVLEGEYNGFSVELYAEKILKRFSSDEVMVIPDEIVPFVIERMGAVGETVEQIMEQGFDEYTDDEEAILNWEKEAFAITSDVTADSALDSEFYKIRYQYKGVSDGKNRDFCREVLGLNLYYRKEDIDKMSLTNANPDFGSYNIFDYKGSYNCRHKWQRNLFHKTVGSTGSQIIPEYKKVSSIPATALPAGDSKATSVNPKVNYNKSKLRNNMKKLVEEFKALINKFESEEVKLVKATIPDLGITLVQDTDEWTIDEPIYQEITDENGEVSQGEVEDGEYALDDGITLVVAGGVLTEIKQAEEEEAPAEEEAAAEDLAEVVEEVPAEDVAAAEDTEESVEGAGKKTLEELIDLTKDGYYTVEVYVENGEFTFGSVYANTWKELEFKAENFDAREQEIVTLKAEVEALKAKIKEPIADPKGLGETTETKMSAEDFKKLPNWQKIALKNKLPLV